ncbi:hypothetical protein AA0242T_1131 [Acetobacter aceti NRIC 0242]|uniref:Uncharacterized protein n=1 Tax=Acetobacter aceti NBRC 14818 TaxID=887700 RepID=A0AB33IHT0_ACEAC|nr:hypothetical protein [Acetobacter aceti]TCS33378.1 hypothetical protein EDC15_10759 [Acetobacter aceti NBRC 14818]BCK77545.1 hypothetical protein EMQ_3151 [Acetobacter aceti NBRC 14818]GAN56816.1 hypothetical protein Abac_010_090 [Acetobacter aceti NBRC 14818]GBO80429.1 hypothetical protein AA0242T_1131 [Acetobacter aceti NRIC 0242]
MEYKNLDETTRKFMVEEIEKYIESRKIYISNQLNEQGKILWPSLLKEAATSGNDKTLSSKIRSEHLLNETEATKSGTKKMPSNAADLLAEGEFNRFYARGVCLHAIANGQETMTVYRARNSSNPRPESEEKIGKHVDAKELLEDLRIIQGKEKILGVPNGANSGLSVML